MPVEPCCAGGNLSPPTQNDHLSLARINEDDRWGRLAALTEAPRQESNANPRDVPTWQDTALLLILSVHGWFRMTFDWSRKMKASVYASCNFKSLLQGLKLSMNEPLPDHIFNSNQQNNKTGREVHIFTSQIMTASTFTFPGPTDLIFSLQTL